MISNVIEAIRCPRCSASLDIHAATISCQSCGQTYPRLGAVPILLSKPDAYLDAYRRQIASFEAQAALSARVVREQMDAGSMLPLARARCERILDALQGQVGDVRAILEPVLPGGWPDAAATVDEDESLTGPIRHVHNVYRDWGSPEETDGENERAFALVEGVLDGRQIGRTLVLGAGGCRLAYDLHQRAGATSTLAIDIDPLVLTVAETVVRGGSLTLRELNAEIDEIDRGSKSWTLTAPRGSLETNAFQLLLADGLEPPVAPGTFDTVVTPWFVERIPADLRDFISAVHRVLKPGGRWINLGPLRYPNATPLTRRFTREEVFDLAQRAAFRIDGWRSESHPHLVSRLSGRGTVERVLAFAASSPDEGERDAVLSAASAADTAGGSPSWMLFHHLPIPTFAGQESAGGGDDLRQAVLSAIDGRHNLTDLALVVQAHIRRPDLSLVQMRDAVRRYLVEIHPVARAAR